jgi:hypothetical protein
MICIDQSSGEKDPNGFFGWIFQNKIIYKLQF